MKKSYLFYGAVVAVVAIDYLIGNVGGDTAQTFIEAVPIEPEPLDEVEKAEDEFLNALLLVAPTVFAIATIPIVFKIIAAMLKP